jgi:hypothetical protein
MLGILELIKALVSIIPFVDKLFSLFRKTPSEKIDEKLQDVRADMDQFKRTGRPKK